MSFKPITIAAALAINLAAPALAADFTFEYTLNTGQRITGSFSGNREDTSIFDISNIAVSLDGLAFDGTISAYGYFGYNGPGGPNTTAASDFVLGAATVSFNPLENNFLFINSVPILGTDDDLFYIFPWTNGPGNQVATQVARNGSSPNPYNGNFVPANWSLTEVVVPPPGPGPVPEPATWVMLLGGFGLVGVMSRRRVLPTVTA